MLRNKKSIEMDAKFESFEQQKQMNLLNITDNTLKETRFKNIPLETVIKDLWNGKTNSQKRNLLKTV